MGPTFSNPFLLFKAPNKTVLYINRVNSLYLSKSFLQLNYYTMHFVIDLKADDSQIISKALILCLSLSVFGDLSNLFNLPECHFPHL